MSNIFILFICNVMLSYIIWLEGCQFFTTRTHFSTTTPPLPPLPPFVCLLVPRAFYRTCTRRCLPPTTTFCTRTCAPFARARTRLPLPTPPARTPPSSSFYPRRRRTARAARLRNTCHTCRHESSFCNVSVMKCMVIMSLHGLPSRLSSHESSFKLMSLRI